MYETSRFNCPLLNRVYYTEGSARDFSVFGSFLKKCRKRAGKGGKKAKKKMNCQREQY